MSSIFTIAEAIKEWLVDHNVKGEADDSMYGQMMRRAQDAARAKVKDDMAYEAQRKIEKLSVAEKEEIEVLKRRKEGTQCTKLTFKAWKNNWDKEQFAKKEAAKLELGKGSNSKSNQIVNTEGRLTGHEIFTKKGAGGITLTDIEKVADNMQASRVDELDKGEGAIDVMLFDDDLDSDFEFSSDEEDEDGDEES